MCSNKPPPPSTSGCEPGHLPEDPPLKIPNVPSGGIFVVQNVYAHNIIVWFDKDNPFLTPKITYGVKQDKISLNTSVSKTTSGKKISINNRIKGSDRNGFQLKPNEQLYWTLAGSKTDAPSFGLFISPDNVDVTATVNGGNRIEASFISTDTTKQLWWNISQVDGYNSLIDVYYNINGESDQNGLNGYKCCGSTKDKCNLILTEEACNSAGGRYDYSTPAVASYNAGEYIGEGIPVCISPGKNVAAYNQGVKGKDWEESLEFIYPFNSGKRSDKQVLSQKSDTGIKGSKRYTSAASGYDPVGCNDKAQMSRNGGDKDYFDLCSCYEAWHSQPSSIGDDLKKWDKYIKNNCKASYSWSFGEGYSVTNPPNVGGKQYPEKGWCWAALTDAAKSGNLGDITITKNENPHRFDSTLQDKVLEKLKQVGIMESGKALTSCIAPIGDRPIMVITVKGVMERTVPAPPPPS